ncbi:MAG: 2-amino-4-hydroxy-6-hydroxymethyldihydropteridine diphosphokinase [Pseudomonadales bacterium]|nr:2-amino-4-hydroxy-6-hydroxymethyldihydropteridine diphosphokinase [Pseudomonadales bacterium]
MSTVYIGLGANLGDAQASLHHALLSLNADNLNIECSSPWYRSSPLGPVIQDDFINAVARLTTSLSPLELLDRLQAQENLQGRRRDVHWGPRTLDLDILIWQGMSMESPRLTIPHPYLTQRAFVLLPLLDLDADLCLPDGRRLDSFLDQVKDQHLYRLETTS